MPAIEMLKKGLEDENMAETTQTASLNAALAVDFTLFKSKITAMLSKDERGIRFLVIPVNQGDAPVVTLEELIDDIKKMAGRDTDTKALEDALNSAAKDAKDPSASDISKITFQLKMLYFYVDTTQGEGKKIIEYAFNVNIITTGLIPEALNSIITVDHLGVAVWNTTREIILNKMSIVNMDTYLGIAAAADDSDKG